MDEQMSDEEIDKFVAGIYADRHPCCGNCAHANHEHALVPEHTHCTLAASFYSGKTMERSARCSRYEAAE